MYKIGHVPFCWWENINYECELLIEWAKVCAILKVNMSCSIRKSILVQWLTEFKFNRGINK